MKANKPDISLIRKYLDGELDERAMYQLERQAEEDPLLMDVIKGMESADADSHRQNLASIDGLLKERINKSKSKRILPLITWQVAASLFLALSIGTWWLTRHPEKEIVAQKPIQHEHSDSSKFPAQANKKPVEIAKLEKPKQRKPVVRHQPDLEKELKASIPLASNVKKPAAKESIGLNEVTIIGYGTQKKSSVTGAVSSVSPTGFNADNLPDSNLNQSLAGKVPGVIVLRGMARNSSYMVITGKVVDKTDNRPLPGAVVQVYGTEYSTQTDANGKFSINIPESTKALNVAVLGYEHQQLNIRKGESLEVKMEPGTASLSEVVAIGYGSQNEASEKAHPAMGWRAYRDYLKERALSPDSSTHRVSLEFTVDRLGTTSGFIVKGFNEIVNRKAVDLIKEGPKWIGSKDGRPETIKLRVTFHKQVGFK